MEFLVANIFLSVLWIWHLTAFSPPQFLRRNQLPIVLRIPWVWQVPSFLLFSRFSFSLWLWHLDYNVSHVNLLVLCLSWSSQRFLDVYILYQIQKVFGYYFFKYSSCPYLSPLLLGFPLCMLVCMMVSHMSLRLFIFLHSFFSCFTDWISSIGLSSSSFKISSAYSNMLLNPLVKFSVIVFSTPEFGSFAHDFLYHSAYFRQVA